VCAFNEAFAAFPVRNVDSIQELMLNIVNRNKSRLMRAYLSEELVSGGQLDMNVTRMSEVVLNQMRNLVALNQQIQAISVQVVGGPGATAGAGGVLSRLFGAKPSGDVDLNLPPATGATLDVRGEVVPDVHIAVGPEEVDEVLRRELPQQTTFDDIVDAAQTMEEANPLYVDEDTTDVPPKDEVH
jgi:CBS domain-containing protein